MPGVLSTFCVQLLGVRFSPSRPPAGRYPHQAAPRGFKICASSFLVPSSCRLGQGPVPWEQAIDLLPSFPHPWYQWVGNLGHRAQGRGLPGMLAVTGRKLRPRESGALWEAAPATCSAWSTHPSPLPSVTDLRLCPPPCPRSSSQLLRLQEWGLRGGVPWGGHGCPAGNFLRKGDAPSPSGATYPRWPPPSPRPRQAGT